jgi:hypothetical protein
MVRNPSNGFKGHSNEELTFFPDGREPQKCVTEKLSQLIVEFEADWPIVEPQ